MSKRCRRHSAEFKAKIALEALKGLKTTQELARDYQVHPTPINQWKKQLREGATTLFGGGQQLVVAEQVERAALYEKIGRLNLYEKIGRLNMELDWLKKKVE